MARSTETKRKGSEENVTSKKKARVASDSESSDSSDSDSSDSESEAEEKKSPEDHVAEPVQEEDDSEFKDETLECRDCSAEFVFTAGEQEFYASKGFENKPVRCKACKDAKKDRMNGGASGGRGGGRGGGGGVCYAFQNGSCDRGDSCRFSHEGGGGGRGGGGRGRGGGRGGGGGVCYAFQKGECNRGSDCRFSHN